jgi:hypothetical protein
VTEDHKGEKSLLGKGLRSGYTSHFVITNNDGDVYDQSKYSLYKTMEAPCTGMKETVLFLLSLSLLSLS